MSIPVGVQAFATCSRTAWGPSPTHGGLSPDEAAVYIRRLSADKRYVREVC
ncbi:hypothetical protein [Streptomyces sp. NPDC058145]|uniref:hypothetical protein n=1 Tax=Streptomyces sp. NPDC058145 TaxID=3346356 RepID=UPI0036E3C2DB